MVTNDPADDNVEVTLEEEDLLYGINKLMRAFEEMNGKSALDKRGELRNQFYLELARKPGERISEFCTRFRVMVGELKAEGVVLPSAELGWFLRTKLGLDPLREQLLETALAGKEEYEVIEREILRLFKDLHSADPLYRRQDKGSMLQRFLGSSLRGGASHASSSTTSTASSYPRSSRSTMSSSTSRFGGGFRRPPSSAPPRQAMATEIEEQEADDGEEAGDDEIGSAPAVSLEEVLQTEAEVLATELEEAAQEGLDPEMIEDLEGSVRRRPWPRSSPQITGALTVTCLVTGLEILNARSLDKGLVEKVKAQVRARRDFPSKFRSLKPWRLSMWRPQQSTM